MNSNVLVVEDDRLLARVLVDELKGEGYKVDWVRGGVEAQDHLNKGEYELVFLDIMLKGEHDGFDVLEAMRNDESPYKDTPVIMLSNMGEMEYMEKAKEMGATDFMVKAAADLSAIVDVAKKYLPLTEK